MWVEKMALYILVKSLSHSYIPLEELQWLTNKKEAFQKILKVKVIFKH